MKTFGFLIVSTLCLSACTTPAMRPSSTCDVLPDGKRCHYFADDDAYARDRGLVSAPEPVQAVPVGPATPAWEMGGVGDPVLSNGDRLAVKVLNGEEFSGEVEIDASGHLYLDYLPPIAAAGQRLGAVKQRIADALVEQQLMLEGAIFISVTPLSWAPIDITVSGAVFEPGQHTINHGERLPDDLGNLESGDRGGQRTLAAAMRSSGGVRPDADLTRIMVRRGEHQTALDLSAVMDGGVVPRLLLQDGDRIHVPSRRIFDEDLARPSQLTTPGVRVFISNLTQPADSNSESSVNSESTRLPYGTRLLAAAMAANCVGGAQVSNASRRVMLVTENPLNGQVDIVERSVDTLLARARKPEVNPVILPGDSLTCYDSGVTNLRELARTLTDMVLPVHLLGLL
ncbi:polysaccharide biosynthesis/export family protein [Alloalcanivorax sp. C16-2]|uniref:polysaccharide biosynthesis/export family protein n=1 Tax=Alloalcanivorax TaxID=3020832 RepID=UPI001931D911|nr:polysaccharide biosynthesis/export family protein [Alloalcanivorax marinus]MBL7251085.1 hypothetical protein [Alloalcanivorax marinus]